MLPFLTLLAVTSGNLPPLDPVPSPRQLEWQKMGQYAFVHFGPNTFTDKEWGEGKEDPNLFNPTRLDCRQWVHAFKAAGLTGVVITAKHHDGFCLWPSKYSTHTVAQSSWKNGKGDVLRELSDACHAEGLKMGVYLSPWDRNHPTYGTPAYNQTFAHMLREVLTQYGPMFEVWFDGANGEGPNGKKQVYDWNLFISTVRECQPNAVIFSDAGPDIRWVGNESGHSAPTCWSTIDRSRYVPGTSLSNELTEGKMGGTDWVPAECDVSIRPGWFFHPEEDSEVKSPETLLNLWEQSVGQNGNLILNVPANRDGLISDPDVHSLIGFKALRDRIYGHDLALHATVTASATRSGTHVSALTDGNPDSFWAVPDGVTGGELILTMPRDETFDRIELREPIRYGQRVKKFTLWVKIDQGWTQVFSGTTVGNRHICKFDPVTASQVRIVIEDSLAPPALSEIGVYSSASS